MAHIPHAVGGALVVAAVSTLGDFLWANWLPHHRPLYGLVHGTLLFLVVGAYLGAVAHPPSPGLRRGPAIGAIGGALIGFLAAGGFYVLQPLIGFPALFVIYVSLWVAVGVLNGRVLQQRGKMGGVLLRSGLAAVGTGVGFYAISGIWFPFDPQGWDYAVHFVSWTVAYLPAFLALLL